MPRSSSGPGAPASVLTVALALAFAASLAGCGGSDAPAPPAGLAYATNPATYTKGTAIAPNAPTSTGGAVESYAATPALPAGLALHPTTGVLSGTPTAISAPATYTVTATNAGGSTTASLTLTVNDAAPSNLVYSNAIAVYTVGTAIAPNVPTSNGGAVLSYTVTPALPAGLALDPVTGIVTGTPTAVTPSALYVVTATNSGGSTDGALILRVNDVPPSELTYSTNPASYPRGSPIAPNLPTHFGGSATSWTVTPTLPAGLTLDAATGILSGTPTTVTAPDSYTVTATNSGGSTSAALALTVTDPVIVSLAVTPATADLTAGAPGLSLTARATYSDASTADVTGLATWTTSAAGQVDVTGGGLASAPLVARVGNGGTVTASLGAQQGSATLRVVRGPPVGPLRGSDPLAGEQWYLVNTGQKAYADTAGTPGADLRLSTAQGLGLRGYGVKVAVVDTGLEIAHPDLAANVAPGSWNFVDDTDDPSPPLDPDNPDGDHGTSVSGIIGMVYDNAIGGMGIAPSVRLNGYNFLSHQTLETFIRSLGASAANPTSDDVWIFNQSFGTGAPFPVPVAPALEAQYLAGVTTLRSGKGALYVKSSGNGFLDFGVSNCAPARGIGVSCQNASMDGKSALPYNLVVGALDARGVRTSYSTAGSALWVAAPGGEYGWNASLIPDYEAKFYAPAMVTTDRTTCDYGYSGPIPWWSTTWTSAFNRGASPNALCDYTNGFNGTSSAAPATVGAIALFLDARPDLTWRDVKHLLAVTARRPDPDIAPVLVRLSDGTYEAELPWTRNAAGMWFHNWYGFGAVDVDAAVDLARTWTADAFGAFVVGDWVESAPDLFLHIPDDSTVGASSTLAVGTALIVEAIQIEVAVTHTAPGDLGIELTSPSGSRSILLNIRNGFAPAAGMVMVAESNLFYGEPSAGNWTVKVVDGYGKDVGTLDRWKIRVFGH